MTNGGESVTWDDPRWTKARLSHRRVDWWTKHGYLNTTEDPTPGSGYRRRWPVGEIAVAVRISRLIAAGLVLPAAAEYARLGSPVEIGPGIILTIGDIDE
jgi:hypothetical protein